MRTSVTPKLALVIVLGINGTSFPAISQERPKEALQVQSQGQDELAGCYHVARVSWSPQPEDLQMIPTGFELLKVANAPGATYFKLRGLGAKAEPNPWELLWSWKPDGKDRLEINLGTGLGGFRGTLKRSGSGELVGKVKEYCDSRCGYKRRIGSLHLQKISCGPD